MKERNLSLVTEPLVLYIRSTAEDQICDQAQLMYYAFISGLGGDK